MAERVIPDQQTAQANPGQHFAHTYLAQFSQNEAHLVYQTTYRIVSLLVPNIVFVCIRILHALPFSPCYTTIMNILIMKHKPANILRIFFQLPTCILKLINDITFFFGEMRSTHFYAPLRRRRSILFCCMLVGLSVSRPVRFRSITHQRID